MKKGSVPTQVQSGKSACGDAPLMLSRVPAWKRDGVRLSGGSSLRDAGWLPGLLVVTIALLFPSLCLGADESTPETPEVQRDAPAAREIPKGPEFITEVHDGVEMVFVPAGKFLMGSTEEEVERAWQECKSRYPQCGRHWFQAETPQHVVLLDGFWIDKTEVTNSAYRLCVEAGGCTPPKRPTLFEDREYDQHPVVFIDWYQGDAYCRWRGIRLPTEAEWEKAARGTEGLMFPWGDVTDFDQPPGRAAFKMDKLQRVGRWPSGASPYGALDMAGNVWEWVQDWFSPEYYQESPYVNPPGPESGERKVYRGGSWRSDLPIYLRASHRNNFVPQLNDVFTGVRCAKDGPSVLDKEKTD